MDRINKASRAIFVVRKAVSTAGNVNLNLAYSIFDKQIQPIMAVLYGAYHLLICAYLDNIPNNIPILDIKKSLKNLDYNVYERR